MALQHSVAKKQHKERAQPKERRRWGLLEKKKDYRLRAQDYHKKEAHLKLLRKKAAERNPDEYYHGMVRRRTENGILVHERKEEELTPEQLKLYKTQDIGYIRVLVSTERKKIDKLEKELLLTSTGQHTVFVEDQKSAKDFSAAKFFKTDESLVNRRENRLRKDQLESQDLSIGISTGSAEEKLEKYKELEERLERLADLERVQQQLELDREKSKDKSFSEQVVNGKTVTKWEAIRKR